VPISLIGFTRVSVSQRGSPARIRLANLEIQLSISNLTKRVVFWSVPMTPKYKNFKFNCLKKLNFNFYIFLFMKNLNFLR
jgi:hypothetical protein